MRHCPKIAAVAVACALLASGCAPAPASAVISSRSVSTVSCLDTDVYAQETPLKLIEFSDPALEQLLLLHGCDTDGDAQINYSEALSLDVLDIPASSGVRILDGLQYFTRLTAVTLNGTGLSNLIALKMLPLLQTITISPDASLASGEEQAVDLLVQGGRTVVWTDPNAVPVLNETDIYAAASPNRAIRIKDSALRKLLLAHPGNRDGDDTITMLEAVGSEFAYLSIPASAGVRSLEGLQYFTKLRSLSLEGNDVTSLEPLRKLPLLKALFIARNRIPCAPQSGLDAEQLALLTDLGARGVRIVGTGEQRTDYQKSRADQADSRYKVLFVVIGSLDMTTPSGEPIRSELSEQELAAARLLIGAYERLFEKLSDYSVNLEVTVYETQQPVTGTADEVSIDRVGSEMSVDAADIPEVAGLLSRYDTAVAVVRMPSQFHTVAGLGGYDPQLKLGLATVYLDECLKYYAPAVGAKAGEFDYERLKQRLETDCPEPGVCVILHEFLHTVEMYAQSCGVWLRELHDVLDDYPEERQTFAYAQYLRAADGIPQSVWQSSPSGAR